MLALERRSIITDMIRRDKTVKLSDLRVRLDVTDETIRKDLDMLEQAKIIKRTYGGAMLCEDGIGVDTTMVLPADEREIVNNASKEHMGVLAAGLIRYGEAIFLDGSTSSMYVARHIPEDKNVTVVTNSDNVIQELAHKEGINVMCIGGMLRRRNMSYVGGVARNIIRNQFYASLLFLSCYGISMNAGLSDSDEAEAEIKNVMMERSERVILLCDQSKFNKIGYPKLADAGMIDMLITDQAPSDEWLTFLHENDIEVLF